MGQKWLPVQVNPSLGLCSGLCMGTVNEGVTMAAPGERGAEGVVCEPGALMH